MTTMRKRLSLMGMALLLVSGVILIRVSYEESSVRREANGPQDVDYDIGLDIHRASDGTYLFAFAPDITAMALTWAFDPEERYLAFWTTDGVVAVCDLERLSTELRPLGLAW